MGNRDEWGITVSQHNRLPTLELECPQNDDQPHGCSLLTLEWRMYELRVSQTRAAGPQGWAAPPVQTAQAAAVLQQAPVAQEQGRA